MTTGSSKPKQDESKRDRFRRLAQHRVNEVLRKLKILGNCANQATYEYDRGEVEKIFRAIDSKVKEIKARFHEGAVDEEFKL